MATSPIYTKHHINLVAANDGTSYANRLLDRTNEGVNAVSRSDLVSCYQQTVHIVATALGTTKTFELASTIGTNDVDLGLIRMIYIESTGPVTVSLLDANAAVNEIVELKLAGTGGTGPCKMFAEIASFAIETGDTLVLFNPSTTADVTVTFCLWGTTVGAPPEA